MIVTDIKDVKLVHTPEVKEGAEADGLPLPAHPEWYVFEVDVKGIDYNIAVPNDPLNVDYQVVAEWYDQQDKKPFDFDFVAPDAPGKVLPVLDADDPKAAQPTVTAHQVDPAELPDVNLTDDQRKELAGS